MTFDPNNPTASLRLPQPLNAFELDLLRPRPVEATAPTHPTAKQIAYATGIKDLEPLVLRVEELERTIYWLREELAKLRTR